MTLDKQLRVLDKLVQRLSKSVQAMEANRIMQEASRKLFVQSLTDELIAVQGAVDYIRAAEGKEKQVDGEQIVA